MASASLMKIGDLAQKAGVTLRTVRYYHELGLLIPSERSSGNFRLYEESALEVIKLIGNLKNLGFSLKQIQELLATPSNDEKDRLERIKKTKRVLLAEKQKVEEMLQHYQELSKEIDTSLEIIEKCFECRKEIGNTAPCKPGCTNNEVHIPL